MYTPLPEIPLRYRFEQSLGPTGSTLILPASAVIGFIPFLPSVFASPPRCAYRRLKWWPAFHFLFRSGNPVPPDVLEFDGQLESFLRSRHYRSALWIRGIQVHCNAATTNISLIYGHKVGFTPLVGGAFMPGSGSVSVDADLSEKKLVVTLLLRFKLGKLANWGSRILTGYMAPSAWTQLQYTVWGNGLLDIMFSGSAIPSQKLYLGSRKIFQHDMMDEERAAIDGFICAGDCQVAPQRMFPLLLPWVKAQQDLGGPA